MITSDPRLERLVNALSGISGVSLIEAKIHPVDWRVAFTIEETDSGWHTVRDLVEACQRSANFEDIRLVPTCSDGDLHWHFSDTEQTEPDELAQLIEQRYLVRPSA
jgi:hypothetical protein